MTPSTKPSNWPIYALAFGNFAAGISALIVAGISAEMASGLGVTIGRIGMLVTIFTLAYGVTAPIIAATTGSVDRQTLLISGLLFVLIGNGLIFFSPNYSLVFMGRIISALGSATYVPLAVLVGMSLVEPEKHGQVSAIVFTGFTVSTAIGVPLGTFIGINLGWRVSFATVCLLALLGILLMARLVPRQIKTPVADFGTFGLVLKDPLLPIFLSVTVLQFAAQMVLFAFIAPWLQALTPLGGLGITLILLVSGVGGIVGNIVAGRATDRFGPRIVQLVLILFLIVVMPSLVLISRSIILGGILVWIWGFVGQGFIAPQLVRVVGANPPLSSATLSLNSTFINLGLSLGAFMGGLYVDSIGLETLTWLAAGVSVLSLIVFLISWRMEDSQTRTKLLLESSGLRS